MLVTASFFDYCKRGAFVSEAFDIDVAALQERRDRALVASAKQLITALESASQRADALAYQLQDYVDRIETPKTEEKPKRKAKAKK